MLNYQNKHLKLNSVNKSVILSNTKNQFNNNFLKYSKDAIISNGKSNDLENIEKKQTDFFPRIDNIKLNNSHGNQHNTNLSNFKKTSNSLKSNLYSQNLSNEISNDGQDWKKYLLHESRKKSNPIALVSSSKIIDQIRSSNNSPPVNINDRNNLNNDIIIPKSIALIEIKSSKDPTTSNKLGFKYEILNINQSIDKKNGKSINGDNEKDDHYNSQQFKSNNQMSSSFIQSNKTTSPRNSFRGRTKTTKESSSSSMNVNHVKSNHTTKISFESLEELHYIYNNLFHQNRVLAYKLDFEEKNDSNLDIDL